MWCGDRRKFDIDRSKTKLSKNLQSMTSVHWCVGLKGLTRLLPLTSPPCETCKTFQTAWMVGTFFQNRSCQGYHQIPVAPKDDPKNRHHHPLLVCSNICSPLSLCQTQPKLFKEWWILRVHFQTWMIPVLDHRTGKCTFNTWANFLPPWLLMDSPLIYKNVFLPLQLWNSLATRFLRLDWPQRPTTPPK